MRIATTGAVLIALLSAACAQTVVESADTRFSSNEAAVVAECAGKVVRVPCKIVALPALDVLERIATSTQAEAHGDTLTFALSAPGASYVEIVGGLRTLLQAVPNSGMWAASVIVPKLAQAHIGFQFVTDTTRGFAKVHEFRGASATPAVLESQLVHGTLRTDSMYSYALLARRELITYLPPRTIPGKPLKVIYAADGALVRSLAPAIDTLVMAGRMEPIAIIGVAASKDERADEYVYGHDADSTRFLAHEKFFVDEVAAWSEANLKVSDRRQDRTIWGASNGGAFAVAMGLRHPDRYARVIALSPVFETIPEPSSAAPLPQFFVTAGTFEKNTATRASELVAVLRGMHAPAKYQQVVGGHDAVVWLDTSVREIGVQ